MTFEDPIDHPAFGEPPDLDDGLVLIAGQLYDAETLDVVNDEPATCECGNVLTIEDQGETCRQCRLAEPTPVHRGTKSRKLRNAQRRYWRHLETWGPGRNPDGTER